MLSYNPVGLTVAGIKVSAYYIRPGVAEKLEIQLNRFAAMAGVRPVTVDGDISEVDAFKLVKIQKWLYQRYECDLAKRKADLEAFAQRLDEASEIAANQPGAQPPTADQMWVSMNQDSIVYRFTRLGDMIESGELEPCPVNWKPILGVVGLLLGAAVFMEAV